MPMSGLDSLSLVMIGVLEVGMTGVVSDVLFSAIGEESDHEWVFEDPVRSH